MDEVNWGRAYAHYGLSNYEKMRTSKKVARKIDEWERELDE